MQPVKLYGVPFSQPVRAVMWSMLLKRKPFELILTNPGSKGDNGSRNPAYLAKNPSGTIPCYEEPDNGFTLGEAHAIMTYLGRTEGWHDLYPEDEHTRAHIDAFLHFHHRNFRDASVGLVAPKIRKDLDIPELIQQSAQRTLTAALQMLEERVLSEHQFLVGDTLTLADIGVYAEVGQLQPCFTNVYDFSPFANVQRWLKDMTEMEFHDVVHTALIELGDISVEAPDMETIKNANKRALQALNGALADIG